MLILVLYGGVNVYGCYETLNSPNPPLNLLAFVPEAALSFLNVLFCFIVISLCDWQSPGGRRILKFAGLLLSLHVASLISVAVYVNIFDPWISFLFAGLLPFAALQIVAGSDWGLLAFLSLCLIAASFIYLKLLSRESSRCG